MKLGIFSFFSGSGLLDLGFELNGFNILYVSEIFTPFLEAYRYTRQQLKLNLPEYGYHDREQADILQLLHPESSLKVQHLLKDARKNYHLIGFIAGPPCPDFSIGGKNRGELGENGKLSLAYIELICQQKPDFFVFENVKGLWKTQKHKIFYHKLKNKLQQSGYFLFERLINAIEYGVPQDRDRIILIGISQQTIKSLNIDNTHQLPWQKYLIANQSDIFNCNWPTIDPFRENSIYPCPNNIPQELTVEYWFQKNDVNNHPNAEKHFQPKAGIKKMIAVAEGDDYHKSYKRLHRWRYSPTACYGNNEVHLHPYKIRRISVAEALAIQSLPANFVLPENMTLTNMFKTIGNGVPYLAAQGIALTIKDFLVNNKLDISKNRIK